FLPIPVQIIAWVTIGISMLINDTRAGGFRRGLLAHVTTFLTLILLLIVTGLNGNPGDVGGAAGILAIIMAPTSFIGGVLGSRGARARNEREQNAALQDRQELLRQFYQLHDQLIAGASQWTFLAVDVVGSTGLKSGSDPLAVEYTFHELDRYVAGTVERHGGRIHSTAGDGALSAFSHAASAFAAAQALQAGMPGFNATQNRLRQPGTPPAGGHSGSAVAPGGDIARVQFSDVLDRASHLQKAAPPGGIAISEEAARQVGVITGLSPLAEPVDEARAYVWTGERALPDPGRRE